MTLATKHLSQLDLLRELSGVAEANINRHLGSAKDWQPHDYIPWSDGQNFAALGGVDYDPSQSRLSEVAKAAMITNLLTEDNLPSYHREVAENFSMDDAWGYWVGRWTAEENRHGIAMRDYLLATRAVDPAKLERMRLEHMNGGYSSIRSVKIADDSGEIVEARDIEDLTKVGMLHTVTYVTFQELATRVSHRNTGKACNDPVADKLLQRIAADENLHMMFYRNVSAAALDLAPDQTLQAITDILTNFQMPGAGMPDFRRNGVMMAKHGIYDLRQHQQDVVLPVLRKWKIFEREDFGPQGEATRERLSAYLEELDAQAAKFEEMRDRMLAREAAKAAKADAAQA